MSVLIRRDVNDVGLVGLSQLHDLTVYGAPLCEDGRGGTGIVGNVYHGIPGYLGERLFRVEVHIGL